MATAEELQIDTGASAMEMAQAIFGQGITVVSASYTGDPAASGLYSGAETAMPGVAPSDSGVILSTGKAEDITHGDGGTDTNTTAGTSTDNAGVDGDSGLNEVAGGKTFDGALLEANFIPDGDTLTMQFVFTSEEYPEYVAQGFNDSFGVWVNGDYVQATIFQNAKVTVDSVNQSSNENLYLDNAKDTYNTEMDGFTYTLSFKAKVHPGEVNSIRIGIADSGDAVYDSNVLIAGDSIQTVALAFDDQVQVTANGSRVVDVLVNDRDETGEGLTITRIMGREVKPGETVTLETGERVTLNADGTLTVQADGDTGANLITYEVTDAAGNTDTGYLTITTVDKAGPDGMVQGSAGGDLIDTGYDGDPDGDRVDADDATGLAGTKGDGDYIEAGAGDDTVLAGAGDDIAYLGAGNDLYAKDTGGDDSVSGGAGDDTIAGAAGDDTLRGDGGNDLLAGETGDDSLYAGAGQDTFAITDGDGQDQLFGGAGQDLAAFTAGPAGQGGDVTLNPGGAGSYAFGDGSSAAGTFTGVEAFGLTQSDDSFDGTAASQAVAVDGAGGDDMISGTTDGDTLYGGADDDTIEGGLGSDSIEGGSGNDAITAGPDYPYSPEYTLLSGTDQTVTGTNGNADFTHGATSDSGPIGTSTVETDGGHQMTGYALGAAGDETQTHSFSQEVAGAELSLVNLDPAETVTLWLDGTAIDLNTAIAQGLVLFEPGTTGYEIGPSGEIIATQDAVDAPVPATLTILIPFTSLGISSTSADGTGGGVVYELAVDTNSPDLYTSDDDTVSGGEGDDQITGGAGDDSLAGGTGGDTLAGGIGNDSVTGDEGDDSLTGDEGEDTLSGGSGADTLAGGDGADQMSGGDDADVFYGGAGDALDGGEGGDDTDTLHVDDVDYVAYGGGNNESGTVYFNDGSTLDFANIETVIADGGVDTPPAAPAAAAAGDPDGIVDGTSGNDSLAPGDADAQGDSVDGGDGDNDTILAGDGDDTVSAGAGDDSVEGGTGNDRLVIGSGLDSLYGGAGDDTLVLTEGGDYVTLVGGENPGDTDVLELQGAGANIGFAGAENGVAQLSDGTFATFSEIERVEGTEGADNMNASGATGGVNFDGNGGDDFITGSAHGDSLAGGEGLDQFFAGAGNDTLSGGGGGDQMYGGEDNDHLMGDAGNDYMQGDTGNDTLEGGDGDDFERGDAGNDSVYGGAGNDQVYGGAGNDHVFGGEGNDTIYGGYGYDTVYGGDGNDSVTGSGEDDIAYGDAGDDTLEGFYGDDTLYGGAGADTIYGGADADEIYGGGGDLVFGGNDTLTGVDFDTLHVSDVQSVYFDPYVPGEGHVTFTDGSTLQFYHIEAVEADGEMHYPPQSQEDVVNGTDGGDLIDTTYTGDPQGDRIDALDNAAGTNDDSVLAGAGDDTIRAGEGNDTVYGEAGNDLIKGEKGNDILVGGTGNDTLSGGAGIDSLYGGDGRDVFVVADATELDGVADGGEGGDDFDTLDLSALDPSSYRLTYSATDSEAGTVEFLDADGNTVSTMQFREIEKVLTTPPCFTPGTRIATDRGEIRVEALRPGDRVLTRDNGYREIRWIGLRALSPDEVAADPDLAPIRIAAGALGRGLPKRDLVVSPQHRMLMIGGRAEMLFGEREVLVPALHLAGQPGIAQEAGGAVTYLHLLFDRHEVIRANGAWTESYQPGELTLAGMEDGPRDEVLKLFPELKLGFLFPAARLTLKRRETALLLAG